MTAALAAILLLTAGIFLYVFAPMRSQEASRNKSRLDYLLERKAVIYENLRDLNFEHDAGKFSEADFLTMRSGMEDEAAGVLAEIATLEQTS